MTAKVHVTSEIGRLRQVLVHTPGAELLAVTPSNRYEHLYDDIIDLQGAQTEHRRFVAVLKRFAQVYEVSDLLRVTLALDEARHFLLTRSEEITADRTLRSTLGDVPVETLVTRYIQGWKPHAGPFLRKLKGVGYILPPAPNLFFTRDAAVVLGETVAISAMRFGSRWPEEVLMRTLFGFYPPWAASPIGYDGSDERRYGYSLEGGDVHPLREDLLLIGISERTSAAALDMLTDMLFTQTQVTDVIAVVLPSPSTAIHLDMVWTHISHGHCVVYQPMFCGATRRPILHRRRGQEGVYEPSDVFEALRSVHFPLEPIFCAEARPEIQDREQWASGCNFFAVAPGQILSYARNVHTLSALEQAGFRVVSADAVLAGEYVIEPDAQVVITFPGSELVRGGGGPRCMTCPIWRDDL